MIEFDKDGLYKGMTMAEYQEARALATAIDGADWVDQLVDPNRERRAAAQAPLHEAAAAFKRFNWAQRQWFLCGRQQHTYAPFSAVVELLTAFGLVEPTRPLTPSQPVGTCAK